MESKEVAQTIAELLSRKKAKDVVMIDIAEKSSFADFFVIATGTSDRQLGALADDVEDKFAELGIEPKSKDGRPDTGWILVDGRQVYARKDLERLRIHTGRLIKELHNAQRQI